MAFRYAIQPGETAMKFFKKPDFSKDNSYSFEHLLIALVIGGVLGILTLSWVQGDLPFQSAEAEEKPTHNPFEVQRYTSLHNRYSAEKFYVFGRETWMLWDSEMQTQFIVDAASAKNNTVPLCWAATRPGG